MSVESETGEGLCGLNAGEFSYECEQGVLAEDPSLSISGSLPIREHLLVPADLDLDATVELLLVSISSDRDDRLELAFADDADVFGIET